MSFLGELRFNHIFPQGEGLNPGTPFSMPDLSAGNINPDMVSQLLNKSFDYHNNLGSPQSEHQGIARPAPSNNGMLNPAISAIPGTSNSPTMNTAWGPDSFKEDNLSALDKIKLDQSQQKIDVNAELGRSKQTLNENKQNSTEGLNERKLGVSQERADAYDFKQRHPGMQMKAQKGGNWYAIDPITGRGMDTGIKTGTMTREDELNLENTNAMGQINARGSNSMDIQRLKNEGNIQNTRENTMGKIKVNDAKGGNKNAMLPTQQRVDAANKANMLRNSDPELAQFLHFNQDGTFNIDAPSEGYAGHSGPTLDQFSRIKAAIYGGGSDINLPAEGKTKGKTDEKSDPLGIRPDSSGDDFENDGSDNGEE